MPVTCTVPKVPSISTVSDEMLASPVVLTDAVRTNASPSKVPVHRARVNLEGRDNPPLGLRVARGVGVIDFPLTGTPAIVPEYGCGCVSVVPLMPSTLCHVIVAVPDPVGKPIVAHPDKASAISAMPIPPAHATDDDSMLRAGLKRLRSWVGDIQRLYTD